MILQIETATASCSVALAEHGQVLFFKEINERNLHAEVITRFIDNLMISAGAAYTELDAIAVSCGPGSYTGLRIGVSTAKGLCFALDKPLIAVETLDAMALGAVRRYKDLIDHNTLLCPMIDARRMEVYTAIFDSKGNKITATVAAIINEQSFEELLAGHKVVFFGDGAEKCRTVLAGKENAIILSDFINSAVDITQSASLKFSKQDFENVAYFEPYYLKEFIAGKKAL